MYNNKTAVGTRCADHVTPLYPQKLALASPTGGGRSVGIVRVRTVHLDLKKNRCSAPTQNRVYKISPFNACQAVSTGKLFTVTWGDPSSFEQRSLVKPEPTFDTTAPTSLSIQRNIPEALNLQLPSQITASCTSLQTTNWLNIFL